MIGNETSFLLNGAGKPLAINEGQLMRRSVKGKGWDRMGFAIRQRGFVFIRSADRAIFIEFCPSNMAPLAALEAVFKIKEAATECVVLAYRSELGEPLGQEVFQSARQAVKTMARIAHAASRRAATDLQARSVARRPSWRSSAAQGTI